MPGNDAACAVSKYGEWQAPARIAKFPQQIGGSGFGEKEGIRDS